MEWGIGAGFRAIQLDAAAPGTRARELDRSARRDIAAFLRRSGVGLSGLDLWIPAGHLTDPARGERAMEAAVQAVDLAAELSRLMEDRSAATVAMMIPADWAGVARLREAAERGGARIANYSIEDSAGPAMGSAGGMSVGIGIDPAALLQRGRDPARDIAAAGGRGALVQARLSDASEIGRVQVGAGRLDVSAHRASLEVAGYRKPVVVDLRGLAEQGAAAQAALSRWTDC
jgi:sugar phosphate isomerase/epimerase